MEKIVCKKCKRELDRSEFYFNGPVIRTECKTCFKKRVTDSQRERRKRRREYIPKYAGLDKNAFKKKREKSVCDESFRKEFINWNEDAIYC